MTAKQNTSGFSEQAEDEWNADDDNEMLRLMEGFEDSLPIIRTYKNDLCTLEICGSAPRASVLTAMAADKSYIAASNLLRRRPLTVRQTVLPGTSGVNTTISTKLFAPSLQVVERAKRLSLPKGLSTGEFLHKFFEAVQMLHLSKFYVEIYAPGTSRDMSALDEEDRIQAFYSFEALNIDALNEVGKAITLYAVYGLKSKDSSKGFSRFFKRLWNKDEWVPSHTALVRFRILSVEEIEIQAKLIADSVDLVTRKRADRLWWPAPTLALETAKRCLDTATEDWIYEHVPMHKMHIDPELDTQGAKDGTLPRHSEEFHLTHAQLVDLAGVFDLYYEDRFTLSNKDFKSGAILDFHSVSRSKTAQFLQAMTVGSLILGAGIFAWLVSARLRGPSKITAGNLVLNTVDVAVVSKSELPSVGKYEESHFPVNEQLPAEEIESLCKSVITKLVGAFAWHVDIQSHPSKGAWTENRHGETRGAGNLSNAQQIVSNAIKEPAALSSQTDEIQADHTIGNQEEKNGLTENNKEIPTFQVTLSRADGSVLGFQPLNEIASSCWAAMPFAQSLHKVKQLKPGFWERPLKFKRPPSEVVVLELHVDPASSYAFARLCPL